MQGKRFLSTPSARRATPLAHRAQADPTISIHALREEGDPCPVGRGSIAAYFYPRPPRGGRPRAKTESNSIEHGISIHALREEGDAAGRGSNQQPKISIHALREEGDALADQQTTPKKDFYPRPPRGGRPGARTDRFAEKGISIHALREEGDKPCTLSRCKAKDFYPRPPRGGRRHWHIGHKRTLQFLSTPSARRATPAQWAGGLSLHISIHALREEGDRPPPGQAQHKATNFYPRPPRGGRPSRCLPPVIPRHFYPRPPRGGRQSYRCRCRERRGFLSTPSARRATTRRPTAPGRPSDFYPRPPRGGRLKSTTYRTMETLISIHALREEGDVGKFIGQQFGQISIHALREEGDPCYHVTVYSPEIISIHALREEGDGQHQQRPYSPCHFYPRPPRGGRHHQ